MAILVTPAVAQWRSVFRPKAKGVEQKNRELKRSFAHLKMQVDLVKEALGKD